MKADISVLVADDPPIFRKGLRQIIEADANLKVVAEADDGESALELIRASRPQVAVLDVDMPHKDGFAVAGEVRAAGLDVALIFLTMHKNERFFNAALDLGVQGYVLKDSAATEIVSGKSFVFLTALLMAALTVAAQPQGQQSASRAGDDDRLTRTGSDSADFNARANVAPGRRAQHHPRARAAGR
ncbi:MAG: response regulator transcription factor [Acidobacteriota bacterium]|nr:response regulator transcription factor [Acidobacteriota bacterium]